ncbi:ABC-three component system protein [Paraburkholderia fungorum]|uniref:ABC-three component system protein n=1 Tax=Paraburkholderia fungorum TaxID=134537 RepID=UPI00402BDDFA
MTQQTALSHSAQAAALGFYFQSLYALFGILNQPHDDVTVCLERLDDIEFVSNGEPLLAQLKHSMSDRPAAVTLASPMLWRTFKAWIDVLAKVDLEATQFQLVTVAPLDAAGALACLTTDLSDRDSLHALLVQEAQRVLDAQEAARHAKRPIPHADRASGCAAFLNLDELTRRALLARISVRAGSSNIAAICDDIENCLVNFPPEKRSALCKRLIEWWDLQVVFTLCGKRERFITKLEVQLRIAELAGEIERDELLPDFESALLPDDHVPDSILTRQIELVGGTASDVRVAVREEWRARSQRHKWISERLDMATRIARYDDLLHETWHDKHERMCEECDEVDDDSKRQRGHCLLRWSYDSAHAEVRPFAPNWSAAYYVRGSYQILAIGLLVGWHPDFRKLLGPGA